MNYKIVNLYIGSEHHATLWPRERREIDGRPPEMSMEQSGRLISALAYGRRVRVLVASLPGPARELCRRHQLTPDAAKLAAEGLVAAMLLSSHIKGEERLSVVVKGEVPTFTLEADVDGDGSVRARFEPAVLSPTETFHGMIAVLKSLGRRELYRGYASVKAETFADALHRYLTASEQVDARVRILVDLDERGEVVFAAGMLVERFPDLAPEEFAALFDAPMQADFRSLMTAFAFGSLAGEAIEVLDYHDFVYRCRCSREKVVNVLRALGRDELVQILTDPGFAEVHCHYCNTTYHIDATELQTLLGELSGPAE